MQDLSFLDDIGKNIKGTGTFVVIPKVLDDYGRKIVAKLKENLLKHNASGDLYDSVEYNIEDVGNGFYKFQILLLPYYKFLDEGRANGKMPPEKPIMDWLRHPSVINRLKLNSSPVYAYGKAKHKGGHKAVSVSKESRLKSLAFLIRRKIGKYGTKGTGFYSSVVNEDLEKKIYQDLSENISDKILVEIVNFT